MKRADPILNIARWLKRPRGGPIFLKGYNYDMVDKMILLLTDRDRTGRQFGQNTSSRLRETSVNEHGIGHFDDSLSCEK